MKFLARLVVVLVTIIYCDASFGADTPDQNPEYYGKYMQDALKEMTCNGKPSGTFTGISYSNQFYMCQAGTRYLYECQAGQMYDPKYSACSWETPELLAKIKNCNTTEYRNACDCRDNPVKSKRGPGSCSCNSNGAGMNYSGCTDTPAEKPVVPPENPDVPPKDPVDPPVENPSVDVTFCVGKSDGFYVNHVNMHNFYLCHEENTYAQTCGEELVFDVNLQHCDWPTDLTCIMKDINGVNCAVFDSVKGTCYAPTGYTFGGNGGVFEFSSNCFY